MKDPNDLIMTLEEALQWRSELKTQGKKLVITNGCFDILHRGHAEYLHQARSKGDALLILMNSDASVAALKGPTRPIINEKDRAYLMASLQCIDAVVLFSNPRCDDLFKELKPDVYIKGGDYNIDNIDKGEKVALQSVGTEILFIPFIPGFSTTDILSKILGS